MMTVKHIMPSGEERVLPADFVRFTLPESDVQSPFVPKTLWVGEGDVPAYPLTGGMAYVMNKSGATVARYDLSDGPAGVGNSATNGATQAGQILSGR